MALVVIIYLGERFLVIKRTFAFITVVIEELVVVLFKFIGFASDFR